MADQTTDAPAWWGDVAANYGALLAIHYLHPGNGVLNALRGDYHADDGDTHAGIEQWVTDHPSGPAPTVQGVEIVEEHGTA